jgi:hypothetical protein
MTDPNFRSFAFVINRRSTSNNVPIVVWVMTLCTFVHYQFYPDDGGSRFILILVTTPPNYTAS